MLCRETIAVCIEIHKKTYPQYNVWANVLVLKLKHVGTETKP